MDPEKTFTEFRLAISEDRKLDAARHARTLEEWIAKGGYRPAGAPGDFECWIAAWSALLDTETV